MDSVVGFLTSKTGIVAAVVVVLALVAAVLKIILPLLERKDAKQAALEKALNIAITVQEKIHAGSLPDDARQAVADDLGLKYRAVRDHHKKNELQAKMYFELQAAKAKK